MNDLVDRILSIYQLMRPLDPDRRLLGCASPWIMTASTPHCRAAEYPIGTLACPHRLKTKATGDVSRWVAHASFGSFQ